VEKEGGGGEGREQEKGKKTFMQELAGEWEERGFGGQFPPFWRR